MKTILITSQKGGSGKTTTAFNLAVTAALEGHRVLMVDLDPQGSLRGCWEAREAEDLEMLEADPAPSSLGSTLKAAAKAGFDYCVVDSPPASPPWLVSVMQLADLCLIPVRPSPVDLKATSATLGLIEQTATPFAFVLTQATRARITDEAARVTGQHGRLAPVNLNHRVAYAEAAAVGQGVAEGRDSKAAAEAIELWSYTREY